MSGVTTAGVITAAAAVAGTAYSVYNGQKQLSTQKKGQAQALKTAGDQATAAEQAHNAANQKRPNTSGILDAATQAGRAGVSGTMLTGAQGISRDQLSLGKSTLLGM